MSDAPLTVASLVVPRSGLQNESVLVVDQWAISRLVFQCLTINVAFFAFGLGSIRNAGGLSGTGWLLLVAGLSLFGVWWVCAQFLWSALRIVPGGTSLLLQRRGRTIREIPYEAIARLAIQAEGRHPWLQVTLKSGELALDTSSNYVIPSRRRSTLRLARGVGRFLPARALFVRLSRFDESIERLLARSGYAPEPVSMKMGLRYRYEEPNGLSAYLIPPKRVLVWTFVFFYPLLQASFKMVLGDATRWMGLAFGLLLGTTLWLVIGLHPRFRLKRSLHDRFEVTAEGLRITRNGRSWTVRGAATEPTWFATQIAYMPVLRFGRGFSAYYLDPRFIEPDI